jgi:hypothetical protein
MKHTLITILIILASMATGFAQTASKPKPNALSLELGKNGVVFNLNYDHHFFSKKFGLRLVAGSNFAKYLNAVTFGGGAYYLFGTTNRYLETGIDVQYLVVDEVSDDQKSVPLIYPDYPVKTIYPSLNIGYRSYGKSTLFRIGFSPGVIKSKFVPGGYISYGFTF